jgi:hypothetical protein
MEMSDTMSVVSTLLVNDESGVARKMCSKSRGTVVMESDQDRARLAIIER